MNYPKLSAIILAAGQSRRMGRPKLTLPWGDSTVIGRVVGVLAAGGVSEIIVVTGGAQGEVERALADLPVKTAFNPAFAEDDMLRSLQIGLAALSETSQAVLIALGDQPQIEIPVVQKLIAAWEENRSPLLVPSYRMRRGHPWLVGRSLWRDLQAMQPPQTLRDFLNSHASQIEYLTVESPSVLADLDTPEDYTRSRPQGN